LEVENDGPNKSHDNSGTAINDITSINVHKFYLKWKTKNKILESEQNNQANRLHFTVKALDKVYFLWFFLLKSKN
jgi:hypothetical protein